ncbi:MAG: NAD-dependent epimerase/dehydratase family protein [Planctomycetota bacterium]|nr:NAD-dependent epimerase/dehydratase family protein [Planctomycetota bacterium]
MSNAYDRLKDRLRAAPRRWLVTGVAGFIGSALLERLLELGQHVVGLDNFATGRRENLFDVRRAAGPAWDRFELREGDLTEPGACARAVRGAELVLHQAALGSVPRSFENPLATHRANVAGSLALFDAARRAGVARLVYASSSSVYGDDPAQPRLESRLGAPLSPYAASKQAAEVFAASFARAFGFAPVGLRYFNVFGPRQNPDGPYAAVIPRWIGRLLRGRPCAIHGDGSASRDFCYVENAVQANLLAACAENPAVPGEVFNVACGAECSLNDLYAQLRELLARGRPALRGLEPLREPPRQGDVARSVADISKAKNLLGYEPAYDLKQGLAETVAWFERQAGV